MLLLKIDFCERTSVRKPDVLALQGKVIVEIRAIALRPTQVHAIPPSPFFNQKVIYTTISLVVYMSLGSNPNH